MVGGLVAENAGSLDQTYATGRVTAGPGSILGGLVASNDTYRPAGIPDPARCNRHARHGDEFLLGHADHRPEHQRGRHRPADRAARQRDPERLRSPASMDHRRRATIRSSPASRPRCRCRATRWSIRRRLSSRSSHWTRSSRHSSSRISRRQHEHRADLAADQRYCGHEYRHRAQELRNSSSTTRAAAAAPVRAAVRPAGRRAAERLAARARPPTSVAAFGLGPLPSGMPPLNETRFLDDEVVFQLGGTALRPGTREPARTSSGSRCCTRKISACSAARFCVSSCPAAPTVRSIIAALEREGRELRGAAESISSR